MSRHLMARFRHLAETLPPPPGHPDLEHSHQIHGTRHTTGGRCLHGWRVGIHIDDPVGWQQSASFEPSPLAIEGARAYASLNSLKDPHDGGIDYLAARREPHELKATAQHYDSLPVHDPDAEKHFAAMRHEVAKQHDFMTNRLGIKTQVVGHDPYQEVHEMMHDINTNKTLKVLGTHATGGHPLFTNEDNDMFRAVHDFFGHAATGRSFDRHGEQASYLAHARMFSPHALPALASETRGQNSSLIYNGSFGPQKVAAMSPEYWGL